MAAPFLAGVPTATAAVGAADHLRAAEVQAAGQTELKAAVKRWCSPRMTPPSAERALQLLQQAEAEHQRERALPRPDTGRLLSLVVARSCAAYQASRLQPSSSYPVWWHVRLHIRGIRPGAGGFEIQAHATTADGPVAGSRVTFSRGLHHACFVATDASGNAVCVMVDTHPHGDRAGGWAEIHEGPFVATLAGSVSPTRVELPTVELHQLPVFASPRLFR